MRLWATGRLSYVADNELLSSPTNVLYFALWVLAVPLWRAFHFYFSHRLLHVRALYKVCCYHQTVTIDRLTDSSTCMHCTTETQTLVGRG